MRKITIILSLILLLTGCKDKDISKNYESNESNNSISIYQDFKEKIMSHLVEKYHSIDNFNILDIKCHHDQHIFTQYFFKVANENYEGIGYLYKNGDNIDLIQLEDTLTDKKSPITNLMAVGELRGSHTKYELISGMVNNNSIETVMLKYSDETNIFIKLSNSKRNYLDIQVIPDGKKVSIENIIGLDKNNTIIYKKK